jgi:DNA-binding protein YbaB
MFNPFKGLSDIKKLKDQASAMQKALAQEEVVVEQDGVRIVMSGDQKVKDVVVDGVDERRIAKAIDEAIRKTQQIAARQLTSMSGLFGQ